MKFQTIFDLVQCAEEVLSFFENPETNELISSTPQLVSRLERLKHKRPDEFLQSLEFLRQSADDVLSDTIELGGPIDASGPDVPDEEEEGEPQATDTTETGTAAGEPSTDDLLEGLDLPEDEETPSVPETPQSSPAPTETQNQDENPTT